MSRAEDPSRSKSPLKAILDIRREEWPLAALMFGTFFLVIATFWVLKPIKKAIFVRLYDEEPLLLFGASLGAAQAELIAKVANLFVAAAAVVVFSALSRRLQRERLVLVFSGFFAVTLIGYSFFVGSGSQWMGWTFYLYGDLWTTLMVATFFAFLNDSVTPAAAKRLYGLIVLGGVAGGAFGASFLRVWVEEISYAVWLYICTGAVVLIALQSWAAGRLVKRYATAGADAVETPGDSEPEPEPVAEGNPALEGARLVFGSKYLLAIVAIVGLYEIVSTILDFQFTSTIVHYLDGDAIDAQFATVYAITNVVSLGVQLLLTTVLMNRFRLVVALLVTPLVILGGSVGFLVMPVLWAGSLLNTWDNAFNYSINQSAREALYTPTSRDEKYKAKAFIDMFVQRFAKALAVGVSLAITIYFADFQSVRWLSAVAIVVTAVWAWAAYYGGRHFRELTRED